MKKRIIGLLLAVCMIIPMLCITPLTSSALVYGIYEYGYYGNGIYIGDCNSSASGAITIPSYIEGKPVVYIGSNAFENCDSITSITIPSTVKEVGGKAFYDCDGLTSVTIANGVTAFGSQTFAECDSLKSVSVPDSTTTLGANMFYNCKALTTVSIGRGVGTIPAACFQNCSALSSVKLGSGTKKIDFAAFEFCSSLAAVSFPEGLSEIGQWAFHGCSSLAAVALPNSVTKIDNYAFYECAALKKVSGSAGLGTLGNYAFSGCTALDEVVLKSAVNIGVSAFEESGLRTVYIRDNLKTVNSQAFLCNSLANVYYTGTQSEWNAVSISSNNNKLQGSTFHWNSIIFNDVNYTSWYVDALKYCVYKGYFSGIAETLFSGKEPLTRSMFVTVLAQLAGANLSSYEYQVFNDVPTGKWYTKAVAWANANGIVSGVSNGVFGKSNPVTRESIALMFFNYAAKLGIDTSQRSNLSGYADYSRIHSWAKDSLSWAVAVGLLSGTSATTLDPRGEVSRFQACQIFYKFDAAVKGF